MRELDDIERQTFQDVWDAVENSPAEAASMRLRSELMIAVKQAVAEWGASRAEAARRLDMTLPRFDDLLRGRINSFGLDGLIALAGRAGLEIRLEVLRQAA